MRILDIIVDEIGTSKNDGTRGSALYRVPFQLSHLPSVKWARHFVETWRCSPGYSTAHRPGITRVEGDRTILDGTTVEEFECDHRDALKLVIENVNKVMEEHEARQRRAEEERADQLRQHKESAAEGAKRIKFD